MNFFYSSAWITASIFIPLIARQYTENLFLISLILVLYNTMLFFSSLIFGRLGDMYGRKKMIMWGFLVSGVILFLHNFIHNIESIFLFRGLAGLGIGMIPGSIVALAWGNSLGWFSGFGSLGYTLGNFLPGILKNNFLIFTTAALFCFAGFFLSFFVRETGKKINVPSFPYHIIRKNLGIYIPFFIRHSAAQAIWAIFPIYLTQLGANKFDISLLYAINPFAQFIFMILLEKQDPERLILTGIICSALTFLGYGVAPNWHVIIIFQVLLGLSWATLYLGSIKYLLKNNLEQATASGFLNSVIGLSGITGPLLGGIIALLGIRVLLFASALLSFLAFFIKRRMIENSNP
ncbi:MAG: MFS transporter [candidate division WOR-3 bacterium]|nr:MFS transporter [candidate division WOR-3 bacterium]